MGRCSKKVWQDKKITQDISEYRAKKALADQPTVSWWLKAEPGRMTATAERHIQRMNAQASKPKAW